MAAALGRFGRTDTGMEPRSVGSANDVLRLLTVEQAPKLFTDEAEDIFKKQRCRSRN